MLLHFYTTAGPWSGSINKVRNDVNKVLPTFDRVFVRRARLHSNPPNNSAHKLRSPTTRWRHILCNRRLTDRYMRCSFDHTADNCIVSTENSHHLFHRPSSSNKRLGITLLLPPKNVGYVFTSVCLFLCQFFCLSVCLSARLLKQLLMDFYEIFWRVVARPKKQSVGFWLLSE